MRRSLITLKALTYRPPAASSPPRRPRCREARRGTQLGLSVLLAARRDLHAARPDRRGYYEEAAPGATGWCAPQPAVRRRCRSCMAWRGERDLAGRTCRGCRATKDPRQYHRQRGSRSVAAGCLWRGGRRLHAGAQRLPRTQPCRLATPKRVDSHLEQVWSLAGRRAVGGPRPRRHFTHSKVMAWVAFDRAVKAVESSAAMVRSNAGARCANKSTRRCARARTIPIIGSFVQSYGASELDASLLLMPLVGFLPATTRASRDGRRDPATPGRRRAPAAL